MNLKTLQIVKNSVAETKEKQEKKEAELKEKLKA